jgi:hypothetical protein
MPSPEKLPKDLQTFIAETVWTFAKTYAKTWPHEYIVRDRVDPKLFEQLARYIDAHGYEDYFYQNRQTYFDFDGRTYWHMDDVINRCPESETYRRRKAEGRLPEDTE